MQKNMRMIVKTLLAALAATLLATGCDQIVPLPTRMDAFVNSVERNAAEYSQEDWETANAKFTRLCDEFKEKKDSLTGEQIKQFRAAVRKYNTIVLQSGIDSINSAFGEIGKGISGAIEDIGSFLDGLGGSDKKE